MRYTLLVIGSVFLAACGSKSHGADPSDLSVDLRASLDERVTSLREWAPRCDKVKGISYPATDPNGDVNDCGDGDNTNFNGMLCLSGDGDACAAVAYSQDDEGKVWRSPYRRLNGDNGVNTSSRDMFVGFMAYLVRTKDVERARKLQAYLTAHDNHLCTDATDSRCDLLPTSYGLMGYVFDGIGVSVSNGGKVAETALSSALLTEASTVDTGYALMLVVDELLILKKLGVSGPLLDQAADKALSRQVGNPFYRYVVEGSSAHVIQDILLQAPTARPARADQWAVQRDTSESAWVSSCGWDYIMVANLVEEK